MLLRDDGVVLMRLPFDLNNVGRTVAPRHRSPGSSRRLLAGRGGDPIDQVERRFAFRRVGTSPLWWASGGGQPIYASAELWWSAHCSLCSVRHSRCRRAGSGERRRREVPNATARKTRFLTTLT
jgi:hypothetical protein